jgi:hypothetical protein
MKGEGKQVSFADWITVRVVRKKTHASMTPGWRASGTAVRMALTLSRTMAES